MIKQQLMSKHKGTPQLNQLTFVSDSCHVCSFFIISNFLTLLLLIFLCHLRIETVSWLARFNWVDFSFVFIIIIHFGIDGISSCRDSLFFFVVSLACTVLKLHSICFLFRYKFSRSGRLVERGCTEDCSHKTTWSHIKNYFNCYWMLFAYEKLYIFELAESFYAYDISMLLSIEFILWSKCFWWKL